MNDGIYISLGQAVKMIRSIKPESSININDVARYAGAILDKSQIHVKNSQTFIPNEWFWENINDLKRLK